MAGQNEEIIDIFDLIHPQTIDSDKVISHEPDLATDHLPPQDEKEELVQDFSSIGDDVYSPRITEVNGKIERPEATEVPYSIKKFVDNQLFLSRFWSYACLAIIFLPLLGVIGFEHMTLAMAKEIWSIVLTPVITIVGSVFGYYFSKGQSDK